ncbi:MAG: 50S ribosomal protein L9 [Bacillales bacterium]|nr:50S ribosomal protein L9 [Bacillales bacterium]
MKVLLIKDVKNVAKKDSIIEVSDGYANNYLFKQKLAIPATATSVEILKTNQTLLKEKDETNKKNALANKVILESKTINCVLRVGKEGKPFGSITNKNVYEAISKFNISVDKRKISQVNINTLGTFMVEVELYKDVKAKIKLVVTGE